MSSTSNFNPKPCNYGCNTRYIGMLTRTHTLNFQKFNYEKRSITRNEF